MKYIRTINGILRVMVTKTTEPMFIEGRGELIGYWGYKQNGDYVNGEILTKDIIKQADTIEELCDEFVYSDEVFKNVIYNNFHALKILLKLRKNYVVYGAVWCDKGLIYVAKLNDEGELELL